LGSIACYSLTLVALSFVNNFIGYLFLYGICTGLFIGIPYVLPINNAIKYFPEHKGLCSGINIMGMGFGSLIFNQIIIHIMNPNNEGLIDDNYFSP
jgi:OFA family oxalate/formate antiporter-like MFS transporter